MAKAVVDVDVDLIHETRDAYLIKVDEDTFEKEVERVWVPKSLSEYANGVLTVEEWFAVQKGLV